MRLALKKIIWAFLLFIAIIHGGYAQSIGYLATYKFNIKHDSNIKINPTAKYSANCFKIDTTNNYRAIQQLNKIISNSTIFLATCTQSYNRIKTAHDSVDWKNIFPNEVGNIKFSVKSEYTIIIDNKNYLLNSTTKNKISCRKIDTNVLSFVSSGIKRNISGYDCEQYVSSNKKYCEIFLWISRSLKKYINPGIFATNVDGGVVAVEYHGNILYLDNLKKLPLDEQPEFNCDSVSDDKIDLFTTRVIHALQ